MAGSQGKKTGMKEGGKIGKAEVARKSGRTGGAGEREERRQGGRE